MSERKTVSSFLNESSLSRVMQHTKERNIGMITAFRSENTKQENLKLNKELESDIRKLGYGLIRVKGRYIENYGTENATPVDENSFLVVGDKGDDKDKLLKQLQVLGKKYKQDSILHKSYGDKKASLYGTKEGGWPGLGKKHETGEWHPDRAGEFHTLMRGGKKKFAFESFQYTTPPSYFSRYEVEF
jgi:hypothetical protein